MIFKLAWRNIWRNKRRTLITLSSISFAVLLSCLMRSTQLGSYERMIDNALSFYFGHVQVHHEGYWDDKSLDNGFQIDEKIIEIFNTDPRITNVIPRIESFALSSFKLQTKAAMVLGIDPEREDQLTNLKKKLVEGEYLTDNPNGIVVAEGLAKYLKLGIGDSLVLIGQGYHGANAAGIYPVTGIVKFPIAAQNNQMIYMMMEDAQFLYAAEGMLTNYTLEVDKSENAILVVNDINEKLASFGMEAIDWKKMMPEIIQSIELDNVSGQIMLGLLYLVIGFGMFGTFLMMTRERMYEFGLMMAIGMKKYKMQAMIFSEFLLMSLLGVVSGIVMSLPILIYLYKNPIRMAAENAEMFDKFNVEPVYSFSLAPEIFYSQAWVVFFMTIILGLYPLIIVGGLNLIKAIRS